MAVLPSSLEDSILCDVTTTLSYCTRKVRDAANENCAKASRALVLRGFSLLFLSTKPNAPRNINNLHKIHPVTEEET